ncbi:MAG: polysaccharide biosynthesis protein [Rikenellaceae bacterium]|nr:polysaccharide biosynthesis protein [Rikenellaceae bacterium]
MLKFIEKLHLERYVSSKLILGLDLAISVGVSLFSMFLTGVLFASFTYDMPLLLYWVGGSCVSSAIFFLFLQTHKSIIRHSTLRELWKLGIATIGKGIAMVALIKVIMPDLLHNVYIWTALLFDVLCTVSALVAARVFMIIAYDVIRNRQKNHEKRKHVLVYGVGSKSVAQIKRLQNSERYNVVGFLNFGMKMRGHQLSDLPVYYFEGIDDIKYLANHKDIDAILFSTQQDAQVEQSRLIPYCTELGLKIYIVPVIDEVIDGKVMRAAVREIKIEDLLGREEIKISLKEIQENFNGKTILVTGAAGSIGSELCRQLATFGVKHLVMFDNAETPMHNIRLELEERFPELKFTPIIGDVRIQARLDYVFRAFRPQVVFHAAAYKHVPLMEENPCEAVLVNVCGSRNVTDMCLKYDVEKMVMISTDKAVNPTNIMGCTKRLAEIYVQSLGLALEQGEIKGKTRFVTTRFGNVLGSNGSVIPRFREQITKGGPVTVTHPDITRFFMTIPEACRLVMEAATMSTGNQIYVFDMGESVKIVTLAKRMIELAGLTLGKDIQIEYTGLRPGEKLYEEVLSNAENTDPTSHDRIRVAHVREYNHSEATDMVNKLEALSRAVEIETMVRLMKESVPEFISKNSQFEKLDKKVG